jgi:predicted choloylglycine hydrolase
MDFLRVRRACDPREYLADFAAYGRFDEAIARWAPDLREELEGLAEGSGVPLDILAAYQLPDEEWVYAFYVRTLEAEVQAKCSAFALRRHDHTIVGQNLDVPSHYEGDQAILSIAPWNDEPQTLVFTFAGVLGGAGMNAAPLGVCVNTLMELRPSRAGLPVAFIVRKLLQTRSVQAARDFLASVEHASGHNYTLGDRSEIASLECSATEIAELRLRDDYSRVCHTNHAIVSDDRPEAWNAFRDSQADAYVRSRTNSEARFASLRENIVTSEHMPAFDDLKSALAARDNLDNPVSRPLSIANDSDFVSYTAASMIFELSEQPSAWIASGSPCSTSFKRFDVGS